ncbi:MAG: L,D-transpeptidase family protein [Hyphomicrobium sp.]
MSGTLRGRRCIAAGALLAAAAATSSAYALSIELKDAAPDRVDRQRAAAVGRLPLPGTPDVSKTAERLAAKGFASGAPILIRIFKAESELELWMEKDGRYELFATYPICHWSGTLGPKQREGDKQTPEGFYTITSRQLHHVGRWPRSLNLGFPNAFDQAMGRSGSYILVHGGCSSVGCFAMTNPVIAEVYGLAAAALRGGQRHIPTHVFPFRMTDANLVKNADSEWSGFWANLKQGYDSFERTRQPPRVSVCENRYHIQDASPPEAGLQNPLAVCGVTAAALRSSVPSASLVPIEAPAKADPSLSRPASVPPPPQQAASDPLVQASAETSTAEQTFELVPNLNPPPLPKETAALRRVERPPCSLARPSCRKFVALRTGKPTRMADVRARKAARSSSRIP